MEEELVEALYAGDDTDLTSSKEQLEVLDFEALVDEAPQLYTDVEFAPSLKRVDELGYRNVALCGMFVLDEALFGNEQRILLGGGLLFASTRHAGSSLRRFWDEEVVPLATFLLSVQSETARREKVTSFCAYWRLVSTCAPLVLDWQGADAAAEAKMLDEMVLFRHPGRFFRSVAPRYLEDVPRRLQCRFCGGPAAAPAVRFEGGELFCWCCNATGQGERDVAAERAIADLVVQCPHCGQKMCEGYYRGHLAACDWTIECPLCTTESFASFRALVKHWLLCNDCRETTRHMREMLGLFGLVGRDVIRLIVQCLPREDVKRLAQCNSILRAVVKEAFLQFRCGVCSFYHGKQSLLFHPGKFCNSMGYGAILDASLKVPLQRAKTALLDHSNVVVAGLAIGVAGALLLFEAPVLVGIWTVYAGLGVANALSKARKGQSETWDCCDGLMDSRPCCVCDGVTVTTLEHGSNKA
jgi:hypothetical protein